MRIIRKCLFIAPALVLLGLALLGVPGAGAQEREPVDLELSMTNREESYWSGGFFLVSVTNNSDVTVHDIRVQLEIDDLTAGRKIFLDEVNPGSARADQNEGTVDYEALVWTIPVLQSGEIANTRLGTDNARNEDTLPEQYLLLRMQGEIVESSPREDPGSLGNSRARTYILYRNDTQDISLFILSTTIRLGVDAEPGTDTFTVKVINSNERLSIYRTQNSYQYQVRLKVTPSPGLGYTAAAPTGTSFNSSTGIWDIGTLRSPGTPEGNRQLDIRVTGRASSGIPPEDQCLTVEIEHIIPDLEEPHFPVTACMAHKALLLAGHADLFTMYDCISETDYPCGSQPSLELVAVKESHGYQFPETRNRPLSNAGLADVHRARFRTDKLISSLTGNTMVLQPEEVVVQVPDDQASRQTDRTGISSLTKWRSFLAYLATPGTRDDGWRPLTYEISDVDPKQRPGSMQLVGPRITRPTDLVFLDPDSNPSRTWSTGASRIFYNRYLQFETLGTYRVQFTFGGTKDGTTYTDSGTYTFHVGPVAELEVRDDPAHSLAEPGQRAYTVVARNHGPDAAPAVRVTLTGVPKDSEAFTSRGSYVYDPDTCGADGLCQGVWTIGEMLDTVSAKYGGGPDGEVLTIIPAAGGSGPITATIENTQDYSVTIDGTTHTTNYYDYLDHNDENVEIALRSTPSGAVPGRSGAPTLLRALKFAFAALLDWQPVERLNGWPVTHYEVQRQRGTFWEPLSSSVAGTMYADLNPGQELRAYRVRAVNRFGVYGPWSLPSDHGQPQFYSGDDARTAPREFTATVSLDGTRVDLNWLPAATGGYTVDRHDLEWRQRTSDPWDCLRAYPAGPCLGAVAAGATSAEDLLSGGAEGVGRHYRIRVVYDDGIEGPWATTRAVDMVPGIPGGFTAELADSGNAVVLTWTAPESRPAITGYVIDISESADGDSRTNDRTVGGGVTTWTHTGLGPGDVKYYRVRARSSAGDGEWTSWQSMGTGPGAPGGLRAVANGPNEIVLTWNKPSSRDVETSWYDLEYSDFPAADGYVWHSLAVVVPEEGLRYVDIGLGPGATRHYRVRAWTSGELPAGAWSRVASATTTEAGPEPPAGLFAEADSETRIRLSWEAPSSGNGVRYNIEHSSDGDSWRSERTGHTSTCTIGGQTLFCYTDSGLIRGTTHWYRVAGVSRSGVAGDWSAPVTGTTAGETTEPPGELRNLRITGVSGRQISLAWDPPLDDGGSRVTGYEYRAYGPCAHDRNDTCEVIRPTRTSGTTRTVTVPNVKGYYEFAVRALNAAGAGWWGPSVSQFVNPQRNWRVTLSPSRLTVDEGGEATYRVRLSSDPGRPVMLALWWDGDPDLGNTLPAQQFKWLLPSNWQDPDGYVDPEWSYAWNTGVPITVSAGEDSDSENGTLEIHNEIYYVPCADLGNPDGCVDDPDDGGVIAFLTVTERDND